jgi:cystathionine gamma-synthase
LADHPGYEVAKTQMSDFGGMVSFTVKGGVEVARKVCESTTLFTLAESLGGVESLIEMPSAMTHASTAGSTLEPPVNLIRLSVGIEDIDDLIADLAHALSL